jgi:chromosome transmission fidelity protein 1
MGPTNCTFDFTHATRSSVEIMDELGRVLANLTRIVPGGIVCFFPSYAYENQVLQRWQETHQLQQMHKSIFREQQVQVENVLEQYSEACQQEPGALLTSVVGGRMSEGINFADHLARYVFPSGFEFLFHVL